jgi:hypothetical protein
MGTRGSFLGVKRPGREADHSPPSGAEVKECVELYIHSPDTPSLRSSQLKHRDNFTFYLYILLYLECNVKEVSLFLNKHSASGIYKTFSYQKSSETTAMKMVNKDHNNQTSEEDGWFY